MKSFQQNLLMALALALCGLCVWQWYFQTVQRKRLEDQNQEIYQRDTAIQGYTNSLDEQNHHINRMEQDLAGLNDSLKQALKTNSEFIIVQKREIARLGASNDTLSNNISQYTNAIAILTNDLEAAQAGIRMQNTNLELLVAERDKWVGMYTNMVLKNNDTVIQYNELVGKYTNLVGKYNKLVSDATNSTGK
jgi:chromosome segregation ATPase